MKKAAMAATLVALLVGLYAGSAFAGPPFVNAEGVGGASFNPFAYLAAPAPKAGETPFKIGPVEVAKPRIGTWYVNLNDSDVDWFTIGIADSFAKRVELSYGYEMTAIGAAGRNTHKSNFGAKVLLLEENSWDKSFLPALSVGTVYKTTSFSTGPGIAKDGADFYVVATKLIKELPRPVLLSVGGLSTQGQVNGIVGFNHKRTEVFFGNIDVVALDWLILGFEYKQGPDYGNYADADYWNVHAAWTVNPNFTLIAAYADAGDRAAKSFNGLGGGAVLSMQYAF